MRYGMYSKIIILYAWALVMVAFGCTAFILLDHLSR